LILMVMLKFQSVNSLILFKYRFLTIDSLKEIMIGDPNQRASLRDPN
jgi:hypothetical protein